MTSKYHPETRREAWRRCQNRGDKTMKEIAKEMGIKQQTLSTWVKRGPEYPRDSGRQKTHNEKTVRDAVKRIKAKKATLKEVADELGMSVASIRAWVTYGPRSGTRPAYVAPILCPNCKTPLATLEYRWMLTRRCDPCGFYCQQEKIGDKHPERWL